MTNKLEIHIIELRKLEKAKDANKDLLSWCRFIKDPEKVSSSDMEENKYIKKAKEQLEKISQDKKERRLAELREKAIMDEIAIRDGGYIDGKEDGIKEGIKEGLKEGLEKGKTQGEKSKSIEIAKNMIKKNFDIKDISEMTGLDEKEIEKLK